MRIESGSLISSLSHDLVRNVITIQGSEEAKRPETPGTRVDTESAFLNVGCFCEPLESYSILSFSLGWQTADVRF